MSNRLKRIDWDFSGYSCASAFSTVHWHPCRFVSQIPSTLIGLLSKKRDVVADPFSGSGTTLIEAHRLGRRPMGSDISPVSVMISESKLNRDSAEKIGAGLSRYRNRMIALHGNTYGSRSKYLDLIPDSVQVSKWYHEETAKDLAFIWSLVSRTSSKYEVILKAAFSSILLGACNETRQWGYVCDNTKPKGYRIVDAIELYSKAIDRYINAYLERDQFLAEGVSTPLARTVIACADASKFLRESPSNSIDLVVTSPPYFGVCDYVKAQRLTMEWFEYQIEDFRKEEIGARSKRHRKASRFEYISELNGVTAEIYRTLKRKKYLAFVFGESKVRAGVLDDVLDVLRDVGFDVELNHKRAVSIQRRQNPSILQENVIVARKK